jgi:hypothetical protein
MKPGFAHTLLLLGLQGLLIFGLGACSDSTGPNTSLTVLPVKLTTTLVGIEPPDGVLAQAEADSVTVMITQRRVTCLPARTIS